jgi:hypothetical protein
MTALVRLTSKLKNQSEFTQMIYLGGENTGGLAAVGRIDACVLVALRS